GSAFLIGYQAIVGQTQVAAVVQEAVNAKMVSAHIERQFKDATSVVDRVLSMTNFVPAAEIIERLHQRYIALIEPGLDLG
ncbi:methyl-accepting chemotaxis protein, partial [Rhizobium ruizarguesonis]